MSTETDIKAPTITTEPKEEKKKKDASQVPASNGMTLQEVIKEQATEEERPLASNLTFNKILGGDILNTSTIRRQVWLLLLIAFFCVVYISNRYSCQKNLIEIDKLKKELQDAKYKALSSSSQLTEKSRESNVLQLLQTTQDSTLHIANQPPFIINVPENE